jgi:putative NADPH-quinone reductase
MKNKLAIMSMSYGGNIFSIQTWFQNMPFRRIKAGVLKLGGMKIEYARFYEVLPGMKEEKFKKDMERVRKLVRKI